MPEDASSTSVPRQPCEAHLPGPVNTLASGNRRADIPFAIARDATHPTIRIRIQSADIVLKEGEWSDWVPLRFNLVPHMAAVNGICRFFLKRARDAFELYVTPVNIDPVNPALPVSTPASFSADLARRAGRFYTQGMAEDTSALSAGVLDDGQFRCQATEVLRESQRLYREELNRFTGGFFFFTFNLSRTRTLLAPLDPGTRSIPPAGRRTGRFIPWLYTEMDRRWAGA